MKTIRFSALALLGLMTAGIALAEPADARPGNGNGRGNRPARPVAVEESATVDTTQTLLTRDRNALLVDIIYGIGEHSELISEDLRAEIVGDFNSLPPGIQRRLARGRSLPPGIAKKYLLPVSVLPVLDLDPDTTLVVVGRNVLILNPQNIVVDLVENLL